MKYADIIERLEKATGPDHALDAHILCAAYGYTMHDDSDPSTGIFAFWENGVCHNCSNWAELTSSIDASLALVERMLPGAELEMTNLYGVARVTLHDVDCSFHGEDHCNNFPIAILLALFKALEAKERGE